MTATDPTTDETAVAWHLRGNRAPVSDELTLTDLEVRGSIPTELDGRYVRNGANPRTGQSEHWFLGDGMVHGISLQGGKAEWYRNRYIRTPLYENPDVERMEIYLDLETLSFNYEVGTANTHVIGHAGKTLTLEEGCFPYELTRELETVGPTNYDGKLVTAMTAHPKVCPDTGELLGFAYSSLPPYLTYIRVSAEGELLQSTPITVTGPRMVHDFVATRSHSIFMDLPAVFDMELAMSGGMPIRWSDDYPARFGIMPRDGGDADVRWFDVDPCYCFHTLNAYDDGDETVVHGCRVNEIWRDSADIGDPDAVGEDEMPHMWEWRFNRATGAVSERQLDDRGTEFPRVPDAKVGNQHRYGYTMALSALGSETVGEIFKYDMDNDGARTSHVFPTGQVPGEPVFVPAEGGTNEDDGYLMTYVHDETTDTSHLTILDASDMAADPIAEVHLPRRIPTGFHGSWIAD